LDGETAQEDERRRREREGTVKRWSGGEIEVFTTVKTLYTLLKTRSLRVRSGVSGKPGVSGPNPGYSALPEPSEQIFKKFDFE
jgi:hypothetical protein